MSWDPRHLPSAAGRTFVVTGGNAGIGYFTAEQIASAGARVILASRSAEKAERAIASIGERVAGAQPGFRGARPEFAVVGGGRGGRNCEHSGRSTA